MRRIIGTAAALIVTLGSASAQTPTPCDDPATACGGLIEARCVESFGAGSLSATPPADCPDQRRAYIACIAEAAACAEPAPGQAEAPRAPTCSAFVEKTLFEAATRSPERRADFEAACPNSALIALLPTVEPQDDAARAMIAGPPSSTLLLRSARTTPVCAGTPGGPLGLTARVWKLSASTPDDRATFTSDAFDGEVVLGPGQSIRLRDGCEIALIRTGYKGWFFAEIAVRVSTSAPDVPTEPTTEN